ncbi:MarR family transcriptional regulator [Streptacidiphilus sp. ASG 303]|uniref:MarR family winged helix-turn-helix transcriptional regulator n=1 Tax=Streptacidiphilus sp. ASG 303 TaxID=2896847 RepID=UPI001E543066|nr:MarR family transcriptional regulator [Streptacidiphilus sp. ASG 303]MCD0486364.1 MarR family transcriptional regulator [Streptacidiphilus sp. ASG 303]
MDGTIGGPAGSLHDPLVVDDQLCFVLYAASRAMTARYRPLLEGAGLTYPQYLVMLALWNQGSLPVKSLGSTLQLDYGTLTPMLKRLEANGLVRRERRADDERSVQISVTEEGMRLRERLSDVPLAIAGSVGLSLEEVGLAKDLLRRLTTNVTAALAEQSA